MLKIFTIKKISKHIISCILTVAILLPFAVQLSHDIEHHHEHACLISDLHIDNHEHDCDVFHFKINHNTISFEKPFETIGNLISDRLIVRYLISEKQNYLLYKLTRAPPYSLL